MADDPHIVVTDSTGQLSVLLRRGSMISVAPTTGLSQVVTTGDTALRNDQRTPQVIWADQRGGEGLRKYTEVEGNTAYLGSVVDARWPDILALPPAMGTVYTHGANTGIMGFVEYLGLTDCEFIVWGLMNSATTSARRFDDTGATWTTVTTGGTGISYLTGFSYFNGCYLFATTNTMGLYASTDGVTWANSAKAKACIGLAVHDNKIWTFNSTDNTLDYASDPTAAHASWGTSTVLYLHPGEAMRQVIEWRDGPGRAIIYLVTNRRLLWYNEDADAFLDFDQLWRRVGGAYASTFYPRAHVGLRDGNLSVTLYNTNSAAPKQDVILQYSGVTNQAGPRVLPRYSPGAHYFRQLLDDGTWIYTIGNISFGRIMAISETGGFTTYYSDTSNTLTLVGGGYGPSLNYGLSETIYALTATSVLIAAMATDAHPLYRTGTYPTGTTYAHEYAYTDGGTPNMWKQALWVTVDCADPSSTGDLSGLAAGTAVRIGYLADDDTSPTLIGSAELTSADTFPATVAIASGAGVPFRQIRLIAYLSTTDGNYTPVIASLALGYIRMEEPKFSYTVVADLSDRDHALYAGQDIAQIRARIASWARPGSIVRLDFAGGDWGTTATSDNPATASSVPSCTVQYSATDDPEKGPQFVTIVFNDVSAPS